MKVPDVVECGQGQRDHPAPDDAPDFVKRADQSACWPTRETACPSAPPGGRVLVTGTAKYRSAASLGRCPSGTRASASTVAVQSLVCPHAVIRMKVYEPSHLEGAPEGFRSKDFRAKELPGHKLTIQVSPDDCTGCGVCVNVCPAKSNAEVRRGAIGMEPAAEHRAAERANWAFFDAIPTLARDLLPRASVRGSQVLEPLFEFSGACAGCGETPYVKLVSQLFGDRIVVANATGCSSIYGGNLPTTPWTVDRQRAWAGVEQLPVRGRRRIRDGHAPGLQSADRQGKAPPRACHPQARRGSRAGDPDGAPGEGGPDPRAARSGGRPREGIGGSGG